MLNAIRRQAIPAPYIPKGLVLRVLLLWHRGWWYRVVTLLLIAVLAVAGWKLSRQDQPFDLIGQNAAYYLLERKPTVLSGASIKQIQKEAVVGADAMTFISTNMIWHAEPGKSACLAKAGTCIFASQEQLFVSLENSLKRPISNEERASIEKSAQHLPPPPLLTGLSTLAGLVSAVLLLFVGKGFTVFGFDIAGQLRRFTANQQSDAGRESVGTLEHFRHEFGLITESLGGRLVFFIDDLDRCDCATVREVLDMVNYFVANGQCFVVLGMAMEHIKCCIEPKSAKHDQEDYANQYLKKLINIEVPVPSAPLALSRAMLGAQASQLRAKAGINWRRWTGSDSGSALITSIVVLGFGAWLISHTPDLPVEFSTSTAVNAPLPTSSPTQTLTPGITPDLLTKLGEISSGPVSVTPGSEPSSWPTIMMSTLFAIILAGVSMRLLSPNNRLRKNAATWLKWGKLAAGGAERTFDSAAFVKALLAWHPVIAAGDPTPRGIKRFVNRVRLFAMREHAARGGDEKPIDDATLVALAALHHVDEKLLDTSDRSDLFSVPMLEGHKEDIIQMAIYRSIQEHISAGLPWPPTQETVSRFKELAAGIFVR